MGMSYQIRKIFFKVCTGTGNYIDFTLTNHFLLKETPNSAVLICPHLRVTIIYHLLSNEVRILKGIYQSSSVKVPVMMRYKLETGPLFISKLNFNLLGCVVQNNKPTSCNTSLAAKNQGA